MSPVWLNADGDVILNSSGLPYVCAACPCMENACNTCDPPIPDTLYVTFAGLAGDFAGYNGKHSVSWHDGCAWKKDFGVPDDLPVLEVWWQYFTAGKWAVNLALDGGCYKRWQKEGGDQSCDPDGSYGEYTCSDGGCADHDSCENSIGATCSVAYS